MTKRLLITALILIAIGISAGSGKFSTGHVLYAKEKKGKVDKDSLKTAQARADSIAKIRTYYERFADTTSILMEDIVLVDEGNYLQGYDGAVAEFDAGNFREALDRFQVYSETLPPSDSLYFESLFFIAECHIALDNINKAKQLLEELERFGGIPGAVMQKVLVRTGQIYCVYGDEPTAEAYFAKLKKEYPNSPYIPLADCSVVR